MNTEIQRMPLTKAQWPKDKGTDAARMDDQAGQDEGGPPGALPEFRRYHPRPGDPDWPRLAREARELAARLRPKLEPPRSLVADWPRRARSQATALRNYAENLLRHRAGRHDLLPLYFIWTTHRTCNFRCEYCDDHRGRKYPDLPKEGTLGTTDGMRLLEIMRTRTPSVYFAGGEPTLRSDLPALTRRARDLAYYPITINTNGSVIHRQLERPEWRTWLADTDIVVVSLDRLNLESSAALWSHDRPEDVYRNLLLVRELADEQRVKLMVNTVIQPGQVKEAWTVMDLAGDLGITFCPVPMNVGPRIHPDLLADPDYPGFVSDLLGRRRAGEKIVGSLRMNERLLRAAPKTCRNTLKPHIDFDGSLFWPCKSAQNLGPERIRVLDYPSVEALYSAAKARIDPTGFHGQGPRQCGAECNWAQNYTTDSYAHGLEHPAHLLGEVVAFLRR
ncbi:MAG: radical SAM protein [Polyangia bacterium]|jgi:MoaA/NifB/PqqE/SkfB family radical SAM enzyme|nr:radical SAM protein [Polyangia bacterium]